MSITGRRWRRWGRTSEGRGGRGVEEVVHLGGGWGGDALRVRRWGRRRGGDEEEAEEGRRLGSLCSPLIFNWVDFMHYRPLLCVHLGIVRCRAACRSAALVVVFTIDSKVDLSKGWSKDGKTQLIQKNNNNKKTEIASITNSILRPGSEYRKCALKERQERIKQLRILKTVFVWGRSKWRQDSWKAQEGSTDISMMSSWNALFREKRTK